MEKGRPPMSYDVTGTAERRLPGVVDVGSRGLRLGRGTGVRRERRDDGRRSPAGSEHGLHDSELRPVRNGRRYWRRHDGHAPDGVTGVSRTRCSAPGSVLHTARGQAPAMTTIGDRSKLSICNGPGSAAHHRRVNGRVTSSDQRADDAAPRLGHGPRYFRIVPDGRPCRSLCGPMRRRPCSTTNTLL